MPDGSPFLVTGAGGGIGGVGRTVVELDRMTGWSSGEVVAVHSADPLNGRCRRALRARTLWRVAGTLASQHVALPANKIQQLIDRGAMTEPPPALRDAA